MFLIKILIRKLENCFSGKQQSERELALKRIPKAFIMR